MHAAFLAQAAPPPPGQTFTNIFWLTIGFIFLAAIVSAVVARRRKDRCLKLFHGYHVTLQATQGQTVWGDLHVFAQGMEVAYDAPYRTAEGVIKASYLLYDTEMGRVQALLRYCGDLTAEEHEQHRRQIAHRVNPSLMRRLMRWAQNWFNTIRDAFTQAISVFIGTVARSGKSMVVQSQQGQVEQIGKTLLAAAGNAYEPMLEMHIGKLIVAEMLIPNDPQKRTIELTGYLAEYSDKFIAIFNAEHRIAERLDLDADQNIDRADLKVMAEPHRALVTNLDNTPLVIEAVSVGEARRELGVTLTQGSTAKVTRSGAPMQLHLTRVRRLDAICSRAQASVRYASLEQLPRSPGDKLPPGDEDQTIAFP